MKYLILIILGSLASLCNASDSKISFQDILDSFVKNDPQINSIQTKIDVQNKMAYTERGLSPTEFSLETTNLAMDEVTMLVGQQFELGNLKEKRARTIQKQISVIEAELTLLKLDAEKRIGDLFIQAMSLKAKTSSLDSLQKIMSKSLVWIENSIEIGMGSSLDTLRMKLELKEISYLNEKYKVEYKGLINQIKILTNFPINEDSDFSFSIEDLMGFKFEGKSNPSAMEQVLEAKIRVAEQKAEEIDVPFISSINFEGGVRRDNSTGQASGGVVNVGLSVPLFSRNGAKVEAQRLRVKVANYEKKKSNIESAEQRLVLENQIIALRSELMFLQNELIPGNKMVLNEMSELLKQGVFSFIDFQQSRKTLVALEERRYELLTQLGEALLTIKIYNGEKDNVFK